ncbi:MAG: transporter substrate-binding protein [Rhodospirillales bacterium]|jgi:ABC-type branched-subunit amino acid transport system substrate-binding protein|nr:transporter substrate-binding protein [Rhodospirillales bacterium]
MRIDLRMQSRRLVFAVLVCLTGLWPDGAVAQQASGKPIRIGQTLSLTGPLGQTGLTHKIVSEIFVEQLNQKGGLLGRPVEYVLLDDQSKADVARTLYERLITSDRVDLILGPYGTGAILASMGVAQRYHKIFIQNTLGIAEQATYEWHFAASLGGAEPQNTLPVKLFEAYGSTAHPPKTIAIVTSKFPSAQYMAQGTREVAKRVGVEPVLYLEYDFGTRDYGAIAARVKDTNADLLWVGALGVEGNQLLEALEKLGYKPPRHFYLYPSSGPLAVLPAADGALSLTSFEDGLPYTANPVSAEFARLFAERAAKAGLPYAHADSQAGNEYAGWQILTAAVTATKSLDDKALAEWLDKNEVETVLGKRDFGGKWHNSRTDYQQLRQVQDGRWVAVWPPEKATPGARLIAP